MSSIFTTNDTIWSQNYWVVDYTFMELEEEELKKKNDSFIDLKLFQRALDEFHLWN